MLRARGVLPRITRRRLRAPLRGKREGGDGVKTVVGMFETTSDVDATITELTSNGFDKSDISVVARREVLKDSGLDVTTGAEVGAITGATTGGIAGLLIG